MKFEVYCDESCPDLLGSKHPGTTYMVIGGYSFIAHGGASDD